MIKYIRKKFSKLYKKNVKQRFEVLREIYDNRLNFRDKIINKPLVIMGSDQEVARLAKFWVWNESEEKYLQNALLEWEFMLTLKHKDRKLIKKGLELRQKFMEECVKYAKDNNLLKEN